MAANDNDARRYVRRSGGAMRVPEWYAEPADELDDVEYGEGFNAKKRAQSRDERARNASDYARSGEYKSRRSAARDYYEDEPRRESYVQDNYDDYKSDSRRDYARDDWDEAPRRGRTSKKPRASLADTVRRAVSRAEERGDNYTAPRYTDPRMDESDEAQAHIYGGRDHDNIPPADVRPRIGLKPLIALLALAIVLIIAPMLMRGVTRVDLSGGNSARPAAAISAAPPNATTAPSAEATAQPTDAPTLSPGLIVSRYTGRTLDKTKPAVALTFDDGPSNQTGRILDALEKDGGLATFFLVGDRVEKYAETAQREYAMGCLVGTHMYSHSKLTEMTAAEIENELSECNAAHIRVLGTQPDVARPPYGATNSTVRETLNMPLINWSLNSNDWETRDADRIFNDVMNNIQDGDIVLFHDLKDFSASAIERIVPELVKQGYQLVTVQELFELKERELEPGVVYSSRVTANAD